MPRIARAVAVGLPHHITQRGNYQQCVFQDEDDRRIYLSWLKDYSEKNALKIWAYCLMDNHVHFIVVPEKEDSLSRAFNQCHMRYSQYFNRKMGRKGHLWQGRFYSCPMDEPYLYVAVRYVERNPVRAGIVKEPQDYPWSSALSHIKRNGNPLLSGDLPLVDEIKDWKTYLSSQEDEEALKELRQCTLTGRPAGKDDFVIKMECLLGRILKARSRGRPEKIK